VAVETITLMKTAIDGIEEGNGRGELRTREREREETTLATGKERLRNA